MKRSAAMTLGLVLTVSTSTLATEGMAQPARHHRDAVIRLAFRAEVDSHRFAAFHGHVPAITVEPLQSDPPGPQSYYGPEGFSWEPHGWWGATQ